MTDGIEAAAGGLRVRWSPGEAFHRFEFEGTASDEAIAECLRTVWRHPAYRYDRHELYDFSATQAERVSADGMRALGSLNASEFEGAPDYRSAIVVPEAVLFGYSRVFRAYTGERGDNVGVFADREAAVAWLLGGER
jgi:hypothetical protein